MEGSPARTPRHRSRGRSPGRVRARSRRSARVLTRRLARDDDGGRSAERPLEPSLPSCVVMRSGLGHHVAGEVVHDDDDARRRGRRHDEVRRQDDVGRTRQPFELREARSRTERAVEARRETGRPLREVGSPTGEASRTRSDSPHIQVPGDEPRPGIGGRQRAQHGPRVLPDPRPAGSTAATSRRPRHALGKASRRRAAHVTEG